MRSLYTRSVVRNTLPGKRRDLADLSGSWKAGKAIESPLVVRPKAPAASPEKILFPSKDGLPVRGDFHAAKKPREAILLCHRSHFNRGEYKDIAPRLAALGFSCLAIDQRSGMKVLGYANETYARAKKQGLATGYVDARPDIEGAVAYLRKRARKPVIVVGSSYSASLALLIALNNEDVKAVAAFSPGEYLKGIKVAQSIKGLDKPVFLAAAKKEIGEVTKLVRFVARSRVSFHKPASEGAHGARMLWEKTLGSEECWRSFQRFLVSV